MLTGIGLRNFKAFGDEMQEAPLSKITLIYGPNSGGKSSIIQALLLLKQSLQADYLRRFGSHERDLVLKGELVDLNSYESLLHKHDTERDLYLSLNYTNPELNDGDAQFGIGISFLDEHGTTRLSKVNYKINACGHGHALFDAAIDMDSYDTLVGHNGNPFFRKKAAPFEIVGVGGQKGSYLAFSEYLPTLCLPELEQVREEEAEDRQLRAQDKGGLHEQLEANSSMLVLLNARDRARWAGGDEEIVEALVQIKLTPNEIVALRPENIPQEYERHLHSLNYLGPLRSAPQRIYRRSREYDQLTGWTGTKGEHSANVLLGGSLVGTTMQWNVKQEVNRWFDTFEIPYEVEIMYLGDADLAGEYITIALRDSRTDTWVTLADVGYGINQLLPVIIEGVASHRGSILCVEQPEIHLHPRLQANIADLMIGTIADEPGKRKQWIVETHSELLITRLQRRIREGKIKSEDVSVLYVDPSDDNGVEGSAILRLKMDENGDFIDHWPHGFFDEAFNELMAEPEIQLHPAD